MFRTALRPRWLALLVVVLAAAAVMARLGEWQLGRARQQSERDRQAAAAARPPVPVEQVLPARTAFQPTAVDARVTASGRWDGARQVLVPGRRLGDATGLWVVTPLRLADGSAVAVVRGWVPDAAAPASDPAALPAGDVDVAGVLRASEPVGDLRPGAVSDAPAGQLPLASGALFAQVWPYPIADGFVVQTSPAPAPGLAAVPPPTEGGLALQNLSYALQWWLFSAFGLFFWWRLVRDDHLGTLRAPAPAPAGAGGPPVGDDGAQDPTVATADTGERP